MAINLVGEPLKPVSGVPIFLSNQHSMPSYSQPVLPSGGLPAGMADLSLDVNVDPVTARKIRDLNRQKEMAVANEEYDEAKSLKKVPSYPYNMQHLEP